MASNSLAEKTGHTQVFIDGRPANPYSITKHLPLSTLPTRRMQELGNPGQRNGNCTTIPKLDDKLVSSEYSCQASKSSCS